MALATGKQAHVRTQLTSLLKDGISCEPAPNDLTPFETFTRNVDWKNTYFGPVSSWDEQLRTVVLICLADPDPAAILWGDRQHMIYNEAYTPLIGHNHPSLQGQEPRPIFGSVWDDYEANYRTCAATGGFVSHPALLTMMNRYGYEEECYFSFKWAPYIGKDGNLTGCYASCSDTTEATIRSRQTHWLKQLSTAVTNVDDFESLWEMLSQHVEQAQIDLPTFVVYSKLGHGTSPTRTSRLHLETSVGLDLGQHAMPRDIDLEECSVYADAMNKARRERSIVLLRSVDDGSPQLNIEGFEPRSFGARSTEVAICPVFSATESVCYILVGLSPKKRYGPLYETFLRNLAEDIVAAKLGAILLAHEKLRGRMLAQEADDERNRRIAELEQSELKYRDFAENAPLGMVRLNLKGELLFCNAAWKELFVFEEGDSETRPWRKAMHPDDIERSNQFFDDVCTAEGPLTSELRLMDRKDDDSYPGWVLVTGYREDSNHIICWVTDISAQKAATLALSEKMQEAILQRTRQENFIDMISHEIRNPLSAVLHCSEDIIKSTKSLLAGQTSEHASDVLDECLESARTISYCVEHQKRIVDDVLVLSKLDANLLEVVRVPVEPRAAIRSALRIFDRELKDADIGLSIIEDKSLDELEANLLMIDPNRFLQVLINLVTNSIKFTRTAPQRRITVAIKADARRPSPPGVRFFPTHRRGDHTSSMMSHAPENAMLYLVLSVSDTGRGLSASESERLFHRFAQASPKTHIEYGGSGLGLFISRQIVEMMGGAIGVRHEQETGCTFAFFVQTTRVVTERDALPKVMDRLRISLTHHPVTPLEQSPSSSGNTTPAKNLASLDRPSSGPRVPSGGVVTIEVGTGNGHTTDLHVPQIHPGPTASKSKVLVVEDNLINQKVVCKQLRRRGYDVHAANHGREALDALESALNRKEGYFSIILCDLEMPVMDGVACTKEIRRLENENILPGHIPMIAVTANARSLHVERALNAGMNDVTTKPYRMDELVAQMEQLILKLRSAGPEGGA